MKRYLIIQTAFIGDVILATATVEALHSRFPNAKIDFLLRKGNESLLTEHPFINKVFIRDKKQPKLQEIWRLLKAIRQEKYDAVINLQRFATTGILTGFSRGKQRIGFQKNPFSFLFTHRIIHQTGNGTHEVTRNLKLLEPLLGKTTALPKLYPKDRLFQRVAQYKDRPYICLAPTSVWMTKQFPAAKWIEFLDKFPTDITVYLLGAPDDKAACQHIIQQSIHPKTNNLAGKLSLLESAALMRDAKMNYVNDSAPLHLASAMNAPVVAVFCSTIPDFGFGPLSAQHFIAQTKEQLPCRPCGLHGKRTCKTTTFACAFSINTSEMVEQSMVDGR